MAMYSVRVAVWTSKDSRAQTHATARARTPHTQIHGTHTHAFANTQRNIYDLQFFHCNNDS